MNIKNIYILTLTICLLLLGVQASAQEPKDFTYSHIGLSEGVSNQRIYSIRQTADGALWWSSKEGVERYNGVVIKHYKSGGQSFSGSAGRITKLTLGCDSSLIAFDNKGGIYVYDEVQDRFNPYGDISELIEGDVLLSDVYPAEKGMWLAMREGVFFLQPDKVLTAVVRDVYANAIVAVDTGLLLCTRTGVLSYAMSEGDVPKENMRLPQLTDYNVESGYYDPIYKKVWLGGFMNGLHILSAGADGVLHEQALSGETIFNPVRSICPYDEKTMLVGIDGQGVFKVSRQPAEGGRHTVSLLFDANEGAQGVLHGNGIYAMLRDTWGNIVIGTYSGGIDMIRPVGSTPAIFQHIRDNQQTLLNDHVNCVNQWTSGMLVMGTDNGVSLYHPQTQRWVHTCQGVVVLSLCQTPQGTMLASTYGKGVYEISENGEARQIYTKSNGVLKDDHVYKLLYDRQGSLWMGCLDGDLVQIPAGSRGAEGCRYYPINNVQDMVQLPDSRIAVGTANGLWLIDPLTGEVSELDYSSAHPDVNRYVLTLYVNDGKELWIGTDGGGVYVYSFSDKSAANIRQIHKENGLPSNTVCSIVRDARGRILIATDQGLSFVSMDAPDQAVDVNYCYGIEREYSSRAVWALRSGNVLYGSTSGALIVNPENIQAINYTARLHILGVSCTDNDSEMFNERVHELLKDNKLRLHYSQRTFDLYFESINLRNQFDIVYQYRVGDGEWSQPSNQQYIRFTNLEPGTHNLLLRSVSRTSGSVLDEMELTIIVAEPWWNSWWMWMFYIGLIILAFYGAWRVYQLHTKYMRLVVSSLKREPLVEERETLDTESDKPETERERPEENEGSEFIEKATKLIVDNLSDTDFNIDRLCREMAMSRTLFYLRLKTFTGKSPQDFIRVIRLERAASMLRGGRSVTDTATLTGFDNAKYFSTVFKKYFGVSPSKYC